MSGPRDHGQTRLAIDDGASEGERETRGRVGYVLALLRCTRLETMIFPTLERLLHSTGKAR